jgi:hypothetical protein
MILTAQQVEATLGPDTPGCDCYSCRTIVALKSLVCDVVTDFDTQQLDNKRASATPTPAAAAWLGVLMIASARAASQGFSPEAIQNVVDHGIDQAELLNPGLRYTANKPDRPI